MPTHQLEILDPPDTAIPDTAIPDTAIPDTAIPGVSTPEVVRDLGVRCQAWLREQHGLAFDRIEAPPTPVLVGGGACRAWRYARATWAAWGYASACALALAAVAGGVTMRRLEPDVETFVQASAWLALAAAVACYTMALRLRNRDRRTVAVAWDQGERPLAPDERATIVTSLRTRWPDAREHWLITLRPLGLPDNRAGLRVIPIREDGLPRVS